MHSRQVDVKFQSVTFDRISVISAAIAKYLKTKQLVLNVTSKNVACVIEIANGYFVIFTENSAFCWTI